MSKSVTRILHLTFIEEMRLTCAFQALQVRSRAYGITHKQARDIIEHLAGKRPKGKPGRELRTTEEYLSWLFGGKVRPAPAGACE